MCGHYIMVYSISRTDIIDDTTNGDNPTNPIPRSALKHRKPWQKGREIPHGTPPKTGVFNLNGDGIKVVHQPEMLMSSQILTFELVIIYPAW